MFLKDKMHKKISKQYVKEKFTKFLHRFTNL